MTEPAFHRLSAWLKGRFGERVYKVSLRGGFTCPNRDGTRGEDGCTFCNGDALEPVGYEEHQSILEQLIRGMDYIRQRHGARKFIAYFQDYSATYAPVDQLRALYAPVLEHHAVVGLAAGTRPDCVPESVLRLFAEFAQERPLEVWLELGLQLADDGVLADLGRGHTVRDFVNAVKACHAHGLRVCAHVIVGLPDVPSALERDTADLLADLGVWGVKIHAFHVVAGTALAQEYEAGHLTVLDRDAYVDRVVDLLERLPPETVVHRVTGEAPKRVTLAPTWTTNKMAVYDAVVAGLERRRTWQGRLRGAPFSAWRTRHAAPPASTKTRKLR